MRAILGLDQGSTKTHAIVSDLNGNLLALGQAPGSLHTTKGMTDALARMREAAEQALSKADVGWPDVAAISGGLTGIDYPYEQELLTETLREHFGIDNIYVHNDCIGALWGGVFEGPAVVCCAGTGLNLGGVDERGRCLQLGNYANGAYQAGGAIGQAALQSIFDAHIRKGPPTSLSARTLERLGFSDIDELLLQRYRKKSVDVPRQCPLVFEEAGKGDAAARGILEEFARNWADLCVSVMYLMGIDKAKPVRVILSGSVFKGKPDIPRQVMEERLATTAPGATVEQARFEPIVGGAVMGLFKLGEGDWRGNVEVSAKRLGLMRIWA